MSSRRLAPASPASVFPGVPQVMNVDAGHAGRFQCLAPLTGEVATPKVEIKQEGELLQIATITRGLSEEGGYHSSGELRLWDNEMLMDWYAATDGSIRSKGTFYFVLHPHGLNMSCRWVGPGFDGRIMSGWASMGQTREESEKTMTSLIESGGVAYVTGQADGQRPHPDGFTCAASQASTPCPLRARSAGQCREPTVTPGQLSTPADLRTGRLTRCAKPTCDETWGPQPGAR